MTTKRHGRARRVLALSLLWAIPFSGCAGNHAGGRAEQMAFAHPGDAVHALADAARHDDAAALESLLGQGAREVLSSGDPVDDRHQREVFLVAFDQGWSLEHIETDTRELIVGHERWPFPIPLQRGAGGWAWDTDAGAQEVLARRIGRNELSVIGALRTYVIAQREYAAEPRDGGPAGRYARQVRSDPGRQNGLHWPTQPGEPPSPLSELAAQAEATGYSAGQGPHRPFHGYYFRILTSQGPSAPGGAKQYVVDGQMTGGFAMLAYPAEYYNSGIASFIVGPDGVVLERDLGPETPAAAATITRFDPEGWIVAQ